MVQAETSILLDKAKWTELKFNNILSNKVEYNPEAIIVSVEASASPLVYKLDRITEVTGFEVKLSIRGELPEQKEFEEDSYFRMGLVVTGENHLGNIGRLFAPKWVQQLFELAPPGEGLDKIYFFNLAANRVHLNKDRINPKSKYMHERVIAVRDGELNQVKFTFTKSLKTAALWISIDGDNTKSKFTTEIKNIKLLSN